MEGVLINDRRVDESRVEAEHGRLDYKDSSDDEEFLFSCFHTGRVPMSLIRQGRISMMYRRRRTLCRTNGTRTDWGFGHRSHWGCSRPEHGTSQRSDSSVATGSADHAGATEEGR